MIRRLGYTRKLAHKVLFARRSAGNDGSDNGPVMIYLCCRTSRDTRDYDTITIRLRYDYDPFTFVFV